MFDLAPEKRISCGGQAIALAALFAVMGVTLIAGLRSF